MTELNLRTLTALGVLLLGFAAYWPALDNPFIADDYVLLVGAERAAEHCTALFEMPLGWRRLVSNFLFTVCFALFGPAANSFYVVNLALHLLASLLVGRLVQAVGGSRPAALVAALFFVAYERHQEPVFWIGTSHELLLALGVLGTTLAFLRYCWSGHSGWYGLALGLFLAGAFTKESFLILPPLLVLAELCRERKRPERWWLAHAPFWGATAAYVALMYVGPWLYPFGETQSGLTLHFFSVYLRSLNRLLLLVYFFLALAGVVRRLKPQESPAATLRSRTSLFFFGWLLVTIVPYSFILYERQLPSRHTYIPSVATAALVGLLFAILWERARSRGWHLAWGTVLAACLAANLAHIWKKDAEYHDRAAPTEQLIVFLNQNSDRLRAEGAPVVVYDFPYPTVVGRGAVHFFTLVEPEQVLFRKQRSKKPIAPGSAVLRWNPQARGFESLAAPP